MANQKGWIKLYRKVVESSLYLAEPFCRNMAWIDLLLLANYKPAVMIVRGIPVKVQRGQVGHSVVSLASRWKWSRSKVERFLNYLENEHQIEQQKTRITTLISILNYEQYQSDEQQNDATDEQQTSIIEEVKKGKNKQPLIEKRKKMEIVLPAGWDIRFEKIWAEYRDYRKVEGKGWYRSPKTEQQAIAGFWKDCNGDFDLASEMMSKTITNRWTGLFPLKKQNNGQPNLFSEKTANGIGKTTSTIAGIGLASDF